MDGGERSHSGGRVGPCVFQRFRVGFPETNGRNRVGGIQGSKCSQFVGDLVKDSWDLMELASMAMEVWLGSAHGGIKRENEEERGRTRLTGGTCAQREWSGSGLERGNGPGRLGRGEINGVGQERESGPNQKRDYTPFFLFTKNLENQKGF